MAYIGKTPVLGNFVKLDAISVVNGQAAYTMQNGGVNFTSYDNVNQFLVSLNGILQSPTDSFTVSGSTLTFASNLSTGDVIDFVMVLGNTLDVGTPSDNTVSLAKLTATGTKDATTFLRGDNTFAAPPLGGITEADQWRLTTNVTANTATIVNWERNDEAVFGKIGTGMSESSGIFTFPSTGVWYVNGVFQIEVVSGDYVELVLEGTVDNSTYDNLSYGGEYSSSGSTSGGSPVSCYVNVTNTSLVKVKFSVNDISAGSVIRGTTSSNRTWVDFIRLGDSV